MNIFVFVYNLYLGLENFKNILHFIIIIILKKYFSL